MYGLFDTREVAGTPVRAALFGPHAKAAAAAMRKAAGGSAAAGADIAAPGARFDGGGAARAPGAV